MGNIMVDRVEVEIGNQFARCQELARKRQVLVGRIEKAQAERQSVKERIFQMVCKEYEKELQRVEHELEPLAETIEKARASLRNQIREIETRTEELHDKLDELSFRYRVGEFDELTRNETHAPLMEEYERLIQRRTDLSDTLARINEGETTLHTDDPDRSIEREGARSDDPPPDRMPSSALPPFSHETEVDAPARVKSDDADVFVDPTEWAGEFEQNDTPDEPEITDRNPSGPEDLSGEDETGIPGTKNEQIFDPLSQLADPSDESAEQVDRAQESGDSTGDTSLGGLPILTIAKGPGAGKTLPLLPMTMTLGREVDNNIELRDMDVARYHARISFEAGKFVIQDLEGSSGTFVNGQRISQATLSPGAVIRVGGTELRLDLG